MPSAGPNNPGTLSSDASFGSVAWTSPENAATSDDNRATATISNYGKPTQYLKALNYGFAIPDGATIDGIEVKVERHQSLAGSAITDERVRIVKGGTVGSTDKADTATEWPTSDTVKTYGSSSDLWGETWTDDDINASDFGVVISADINLSAARVARIDHITITVHYTEAAAGGVKRHMLTLGVGC